MYKICKTEGSTKRQREIELTLLRLMSERRYEDISVIELCDASGVPRKAFYRYFDNKDAALQGLIDHTLEEYERFTQSMPRTEKPRRLSGDLERFFLFWTKQRELLTAIDRNNLFVNLMNSSLRFPINDITSMRKFLPYDSEWMRSQVFSFAICGLMFIMLEWFRRDFQESVHDMAKMACRTLSTPLFPVLKEVGILNE